MSSRPPAIAATLATHDILGAQGCSPMADRCNILVKLDQVRLSDSRVILEVTHMAVEGYGQDAFWNDHIFMPKDSELQKQTVKWCPMQPLPEHGQLTWLRNVINLDLDGINYVYDAHSFCMPLVRNMVPNTINWLELFAGGFGGWKSAADFVTSQISAGDIRSIAVEHDVNIAMSYAITNHTGFVQQEHPLSKDFFQNCPGDWVIRDDVMSPKWKQAVAAIGIDAVSISAPCPPWSGASHAPGLNRDDGMLLMESILEARYFRPLLIHVEQVVNFAQHPHRSIIIRALHWIGYKVIFQRTLNVTDSLHTDRPRFLLVALRVHGDVCLESVPIWNFQSFTFPSCTAIFQCWTPDTQQELVLTDDVLKVANDPRLTRMQVPTGKTVLDTRVYSSDAVTPTFMSMYGQQHELDFDYLLIHKFYGHYVRDDQFPNGCRHWHPSEITLKHGLTNQAFQFDDHRQAWIIQGNIVTPLQVIPLVVLTCNAFWNASVDVQEVIEKYMHARWSAEDVGFQRLTDGFLMTLLQDPISPEQMAQYDMLTQQLRNHPFENHVWTPTAPCIPSSNPHQILATQITLPSPDSAEEEPATQPFQVILQGIIRLEARTQKYWFDASVPYDRLVEPWDSVYSPFTMDSHNPGDPCVELVYDLDRRSYSRDDLDTSLLMILADEALTIMEISKTMNVVDHPVFHNWDTLFDQFGEIQPYQRADEHLLVMPRPLPPPNSSSMAVMVVAAEAVCQQNWTTTEWDRNPCHRHTAPGHQR
eukprot:Skav201481  [mRNA]  locus=scaffold828:142627:144900:- [translate_table: standard]